MAGKTITQLPLATTPLAGTEVLPIVRSGVTYKTTVADVAKSPQDGATANAVVYYNGSKAPASSSAFTFDGTTVAVTNPMRTSAGTAAAPAVTPTGDTNTGIFFPAADTIAFAEGGAETMRLDSAGNVGIGTTAPGTRLSVQSATQFNGINVRNASNTIVEIIGFGSANDGGGLKLYSGGSARAEIRSDGDSYLLGGSFLVGATGFVGSGTTRSGLALFNQDNLSGRINLGKTTSGTRDGIQFNHNGSTVGTVTYSDTATAYNTSSDYRLKEDIQPMTGALAKVALLKPCTYKWKVDGSDGEGFIAHELQAVVPHCVTGEKDAVDADGKPVYQGIDTSFLVATLTAAIQEQQAIIESLTARVAALEAK